MKLRRITESDAVDACEESMDGRHTESILFLRDDSGEWFAYTKVDQGSYTAQSWWWLHSDELTAEFEAVLEAARIRDRECT